jgi:hypothetical protein
MMPTQTGKHARATIFQGRAEVGAVSSFGGGGNRRESYKRLMWFQRLARVVS